MLRGWMGWVKAISYEKTILYLLCGSAANAEHPRIWGGFGGVMGQMPEKRGVVSDRAEGGKVRLMEVVRRKIRAKHYSLRTEQAYLGVGSAIHFGERAPASA